MKITLDCRHINSSGGIGIYFKELFPFFLASGASIILLGDKNILPQTAQNNALQSNVAQNNDIEIIHCNIKPFSLRDTFFFPRLILKKINSGDIFYTPYFNIPNGIKISIYTTIHDIIFPDMPNLVSKPGLWMRMYFYKRAAGLSKAIFTVSEFSKSRIKHFLGDSLNVINALNAIKAPFQVCPQNQPVKKKKILFIGNIKKHKGLNILLDAFLQCRNEGLDYELIIVGSRDNFRSGDKRISKRLDTLEGRGVIFTGYINDAEKWKLLAESALLVQPSLYEGFGYPPLEAMFSGTQALISDISVFKEVYSDFPVIFFNTGDSRSLHDKLMEILSGKIPQAIYLDDAIKNKYTYEKTFSIIKETMLQPSLLQKNN
jgi:glycosyltransferase involved in cell wall biosynthesis